MSSLRKVGPNVQAPQSGSAPASENAVVAPQVAQRSAEVLHQVLSAFSFDQKEVLTQNRQNSLPNPLEKLTHLVRDLSASRSAQDEFLQQAETQARPVCMDGKTVNIPSPSGRLQALRDAIDDGRLGEGELFAHADLKSAESCGASAEIETGPTTASGLLDEAMEGREEGGTIDAVQEMTSAADEAEPLDDTLGASLSFLLDRSARRELLSDLRRSFDAQAPALLSEEEQGHFQQLSRKAAETAGRRLDNAATAQGNAAQMGESDLSPAEDGSDSSSSKVADGTTDSDGTPGSKKTSSASSRSSAAPSMAGSASPSSAAAYAAGSASRSSAMPASGTASRSRTATATGSSSKSRAATASGIASKSSAAIADDVDLDAITSLDLSPTEQDLYDKLEEEDPDAAERFLLQQKLAKISELAAMLSNIAKMRHDAAMAIIGNMRG